jgi:hypothetical protein
MNRYADDDDGSLKDFIRSFAIEFWIFAILGGVVLTILLVKWICGF